MRFLPCPQHAKHFPIQTLCGRHTPKLTKISSFFHKFHTFPVTEGYAIWHSISSSQPWQESSPTEWNSSTQKDTNFGNAIILRYLDSENCQNQPERHKFCTKLHSLTPATMPRKVFIFPEFCTSFWNTFIHPIHTSQTTTWEHLVAWFPNCRAIVTHSDSSALVQDAILNCYKKPAHYYYQFSNFFRRPTSSCVVF